MMPEVTGGQPGSEAGAAETAAAQAATVQTDAPQTFVNPDGSFKEGWVDAYVPEDLRHLGDFKPITTVAELAKQFGHAKTLIGRQGKGIMPLSKDAGPTEKEAYYAALGRPKTPADYKVEIPKELAEFYPQGEVAEALAFFHQKGLSQDAITANFEFDTMRMQKAIQEREQAHVQAVEECVKTLTKEWGDAYEAKMHAANRCITENVPAEKLKELTKRYQADADLIRALAAIGESYQEDTLVEPGSAGQRPMTPDELEAKARDLMTTPGYAAGSLPEATKARLTKEINALYAAARQAREAATKG